MIESNLLSPGSYGHGQRLRREVSNAISAAELAEHYNLLAGGTGSDTAIQLAAFLADAAAKTPGFVPPAPAPLPTTDAIVSNGGVVDIGGVTYTFTVVDSVITNIVVA